jgi:diguanylate cyclase (GGDEF)-like protein
MTPGTNTVPIQRSPLAFLQEWAGRRPDSEHAQALVRIIIAGIGCLYIFLVHMSGRLAADQQHMLYLVPAVLGISIGIFVLIIVWPRASPLRRIVGMVFDFGITSYFMYVMKQNGVMFFPVYLWVTIGNGLRYGTRYLYTAMFLSIASFGTVLAGSAYWRGQWGFSIGLLAGLVALPLYFSSLLKQLGQQHSELRKLYQQMARHATHDSLTGLPNRKHFHDQLAATITSAEREKKSFAVLYLDLDGFKAINDALGHAAGDQIIADTARRLEQCVRKRDVVSRVGGDEFVVLLRDIGSSDAVRMASKIIEVLSQPFTVAASTHRITTSIGVAHYPRDGTDMHTLIHNADSAMYETKRSGKNGYRICGDRLVSAVP